MTTPDDRGPVRGSATAHLRLLVVDADRRVRSSLAGLLSLADQVEVVGSAGGARAALDACERSRPDAVVVDPRLPELPDGIAFIRGLRARRPAVRVVVIAWSPALAPVVADDEGISVVSPDGGDLAERIVEALRATPGPTGSRSGDPVERGLPGADARLETSARERPRALGGTGWLPAKERRA
jgi:CheY-like chemotaxis protein